MVHTAMHEGSDEGRLATLLGKLDRETTALAAAPVFAKPGKLTRLYDIARRILLLEGGPQSLEDRALALEAAGVFVESDWDTPQTLIPSYTPQTLASIDAGTVMVEALSELRFLAVALGEQAHPSLSREQAHHFLTQVLAANMRLLFTAPSEAERLSQGRLATVPRLLMRHLGERVGFHLVVDRLIDEIWRILHQRPIQTDGVKEMISQIALCLHDPTIDLGASAQGADRLVSSLFGPTRACQEDPGTAVYHERLAAMDQKALSHEATGCARAMHDTGLVSPYHAVLLRHVLDLGDHLLCEALGLSSTGRECLLCYRQLVEALIRAAVQPTTAQAVYGLTLLLERGILYQPPLAPSLWRQLALPLSPTAQERLAPLCPEGVSLQARLLEGVLCMLGLPLGVGQGNNPTCQSARALSMWAYNDPDYLLQMVAWAVRDNEIIMHFEGQAISSAETAPNPATGLPIDLDPVSLLLVPHLDRIYLEMGRRCAGRDGDPHRWINPEFHGWWCGRGFHINVDVASGQLINLDRFLRQFFVSYHPFYNGNQPLIHPQPAGIAITDHTGRFLGWHAITILRVALDHTDCMRVYFFNPNNDSGQDWGDDILVSTADHGERFGESSLPIEQFAARLYIFHDDPLEQGDLDAVDPQAIERIIAMIHRSWGAERLAGPVANAAASLG